jgi:branched-chain amino acid aminotransferase
VLEAPTSSLFWVTEEGELVTPPLDEHILASITRDRVLRLCDVVERPGTKEDVLAASEAFIASTTREVQPVAAVEERELETGPRTREAADRVRAHIAESLG